MKDDKFSPGDVGPLVGWVIILLSGHLSLSFEILAIRFFTPVVGSGHVQTGFIIGFVLLFGALGNHLGDRVPGPSITLRRNLLLLLPTMGPLLAHSTLREASYFLPSFGHPTVKLVVLCLLVLALPAYLFGQNFTLMFRLKFLPTSGKIIGTSTLGACVGSVGTVLLIVYLLAASTMAIVNIALVLVILLLLWPRRVFLALALALPGILVHAVLTPRYVQHETGMANYNVLRDHRFKGLVIDGKRYHSLIFPDNRAIEYIEYIHARLLSTPEKKDVLVLGAGGFTASLKNRHHSYVYVDIDPRIKKVIEENFNPAIHGTFVHADARAFLIDSQKQFDVILQDAFGAAEVPPLHLLTYEHFQEIKKDLRPDGFFVLNTLHLGNFYADELSREIFQTLNAVFGGCYYVPGEHVRLWEKTGLKHTLVLCQRWPDRPAKVRTDDQY